jgi:hypothetical protein
MWVGNATINSREKELLLTLFSPSRDVSYRAVQAYDDTETLNKAIEADCGKIKFELEAETVRATITDSALPVIQLHKIQLDAVLKASFLSFFKKSLV